MMAGLWLLVFALHDSHIVRSTHETVQQCEQAAAYSRHYIDHVSKSAHGQGIVVKCVPNLPDDGRFDHCRKGAQTLWCADNRWRWEPARTGSENPHE